MSRNSKTSVFADFSGGLNVAASPTTVGINQSIDLDNIVLLPKSGFKKRNGNTVLNSSVMDSGKSVHGLAYLRDLLGNEWGLAITGSKIYKTEALDGTMDDVTGAVTITEGKDNVWVNSQMNDISIFVGGNLLYDVPIKWAGSGNASALGGTPPVGEFCALANNRLFIGNTAANPSRIKWCALGNPEDWSGAGSGSQDVSTNDGDFLVTAKLLGTNHLLVFKQNSIHELMVTSSPFPVYPLFRGVGAISKRGVVDVDGVLYFVTPEPRMKATDGTNIQVFPEDINPLWDSLNKSRLKYIVGIYDKTRRWVMWFCSSGSSTTNNLCIIWDLYRKCWLRCTTGHSMNCVDVMRDSLVYGGAYDGKVYRMNAPSVFKDASEGNAAIDSYWYSGWMDMEDMILSKSVLYADLGYMTQSSGTFNFSYGFDFDPTRKTVSINMQEPGAVYGAAIYDVDVYGGLSDATKFEFMKGRGKFFQFGLQNNIVDCNFQFNRLALPIKTGAPTAAR